MNTVPLSHDTSRSAFDPLVGGAVLLVSLLLAPGATWAANNGSPVYGGVANASGMPEAGVQASGRSGASADTLAPGGKNVNWTGFYVGISAGAIFNDSDLKSSQISLVEDPCKRNIESTSFLPGVHVGYLRQLSEGWVVGGEADFTYPDSSGSANCLCFNSTFDKFTVKNRIQGALRGRVGYALENNLLPYITAGVSFADTSLRYVNESGDSYSQNTAQTGWVLGGGMEYGFREHFSVRAEYLYSDYGDALSTRLPIIQGIADPSGTANADLASHTVRAALNYRF